MADTDLELDQYPVVIIEDRYNGAYSGGRWIAIANANRTEFGLRPCEQQVGDMDRATYLLEEYGTGPHGGDPEAAAFWLNAPDWMAVGDTPDQAMMNLRNGVKATGR